MKKYTLLSICFLFLFCNQPKPQEIQLSPYSWTDLKSQGLKGNVKGYIEYSRSAFKDELSSSLDSAARDFEHLNSFNDTTFVHYYFNKTGLITETYRVKDNNIHNRAKFKHQVKNGLVIKRTKLKESTSDSCDYVSISYNSDTLIESITSHLCNYNKSKNTILGVYSRYYYQKSRCIQEVQESTENWKTTINHQYNSNGILTKKISSGNNVNIRTFNKYGDAITHSYKNKKEVIYHSYIYKYDQKGNWVEQTDKDQTFRIYRKIEYY